MGMSESFFCRPETSAKSWRGYMIAFYLNTKVMWLSFPFFCLPHVHQTSYTLWYYLSSFLQTLISSFLLLMAVWSSSFVDIFMATTVIRVCMLTSKSIALNFTHQPLSGDLQACEYVPLAWLSSSPSPQCVQHHWACEVLYPPLSPD